MTADETAAIDGKNELAGDRLCRGLLAEIGPSKAEQFAARRRASRAIALASSVPASRSGLRVSGLAPMSLAASAEALAQRLVPEIGSGHVETLFTEVSR